MYNFRYTKGVKMKAGEYIKIKRKEKNMSLRQVAYKTGLSHTYISDIEKGNLIGTNETHEKIISGLNFTSEEKKAFYNLLIEDRALPKYIIEKMNSMEKEIKSLKDENEKLKAQIIIKNNSNAGDIMVDSVKTICTSFDEELKGLNDNDVQSVRNYIAFLKNKNY